MNGIHDMGGMHGFGPVVTEDDAGPVFHAEWEKRVFAIGIALQAASGSGFDLGRANIEALSPDEYLQSQYFERWLAGFYKLLRLAGVFDEGEIEALAAGRAPRPADRPGAAPEPAVTAAIATSFVERGHPTLRPSEQTPLYHVGHPVRARNFHPRGHTRLPRYVRGRRGVVVADHGAHVFPDSVTAGLGEDPKRLYTVRFTAAELWGEGAKDRVHVDLWEPYLEPA